MAAMPNIEDMLAGIAAERSHDPLAPVTVIAPSHVAALQLRRRLAELGPFAAVRLETLPRIAELLGAGHLAAAGRSPLARPIGDYVAKQVALESTGGLERVRELPGYARVLRQLFRRLRRGGIRRPGDVASIPRSRHFEELLGLYGRFREETDRFYDEEDLLDAAAQAVVSGGAGVLADLGAITVMPPLRQSAGAERLLAALRAAAPSYVELEDCLDARAEMRFVLAPDPASEAREAVREVLTSLEAGVPLHAIGIFYGADSAYGSLLRDALAAADVPAVVLPGTPLIQSRAGRGVLALSLLPQSDFSRTAVMDFLSAAPLRAQLPASDGAVPALTSMWDRISRDAGITRRLATWGSALQAFIDDHDARLAGDTEEGQVRRSAWERDRQQANRLRDVVQHLSTRLEPLRNRQAAKFFITAFKAIVREYLDPNALGVEEVVQEIDQLGTIGAVEGSLDLVDFSELLRANLEIAAMRENRLGDGVLVADYRAAAGLQFQQVIVCGAREGIFPAGPGQDALVEDRVWEELRGSHPYIEDAELRIDRARQAAQRSVAAAVGRLVWCTARYEPGGTREYYPSRLMVEAARRHDAAIDTGSALRHRRTAGGWLRRGASPLGMRLVGPPVDAAEARLRLAISFRQKGRAVEQAHPRWDAVAMIRARYSDRFTKWDGNLNALQDDAWLELQSAVYPTSLETYALCGFRYLCASLLRLNVTAEPEERGMMDPAARGTLVHSILDGFFKEQHRRGRPECGEAWTAADREELLALADLKLEEFKQRGLLGLEVFAGHERRTLRSDLAAFLDEDTAFRRETRAVPIAFELRVPEVSIAGVKMRGRVDRIDRTLDGRVAWVIDYKTGKSDDYDALKLDDPLVGGTRLQLPTYLQAVPEAEEVHACYWFVTQKGDFKRVPYEPTPRNQAAFEQTLAAIVSGIRAGAFPAVPGKVDEYRGGFANCRFCDFDRICPRRREEALAEKSQGDEDSLMPWLVVAPTSRPAEGDQDDA